MTESYFEEGRKRAMALGNRGPLRFDDDGNVHPDILDAYWKYGFYVFEGVVGDQELAMLREDFERVVDRAPAGPGAKVDRHGNPALDADLARPGFQFAKPLSDPMGATDVGNGRYQVKMQELTPKSDAPEEVLLQINGNLQHMDSALRLYGHPQLLKVAEAINGADFTPFTDAIWVKPAGLGAAVSWHQDGMTLWESPDLDAGTHGFNFMAQLYPTTPRNALWIVPETHDIGKIDIQQRVAENGGSDKLPDGVPLLCDAGDVAVCSRQMLHCSFPNDSEDPRVTFVFGFHRRASVQNVEARDVRSKAKMRYDDERIHQRSRIISLAIDARQQQFPDEPRYVYQPLVGEEDENRWCEATRQSLLRNYNLNDLSI